MGKTKNEEMRRMARQTWDLVARFSATKGLISLEEIATMTGLNKNSATLRALVNSPDFPAPVFLGERSRRWFSGEVATYLERRREKRFTD